MPRGRPVQLSAEQIVELERMATIGLTQPQIVRIFGFHLDTLTERLKDQPGVREAWERGKAHAADVVLSILWELIEARNPAAVFFYCKTQLGWRETNKLEVSGGLTIEQAILEATDQAGAKEPDGDPDGDPDAEDG